LTGFDNDYSFRQHEEVDVLRFQSDRDEIDGVGLSIWFQSFKTAAVTSFRAEKCCHLVSVKQCLRRAYATVPGLCHRWILSLYSCFSTEEYMETYWKEWKTFLFRVL